MYLLITVPTGFEKEAISEVEKISNKKIIVKTTYFKGVLLGKTKLKKEEVKKVLSKDTTFIRKVIPVDRIEKTDIDKFVQFFSKFNLKGKKFAVRCKRRGVHNFASKEVEVRVGKVIKKLGGIVDLENPEIILSIEILQDFSCLSILTTKDIIVKKAKVEKKWKKEERPICRSELKIREIIKRYGFVFSKDKVVLDIGSAPGGWVREISKRVKKVFAVDPAELEVSVKSLKNVVHIKKKAQEIELKDRVDVITNDANILDKESAEVSITLSNKFLKKGGFLIHTIKMERFSKSIVEEIEKMFKYSGIEKISLLKLRYNTRNEITFIGRKHD